MTKIDRVKAALVPGTRLLVASNPRNPKTEGCLRTVVQMRTTRLDYQADEAPGAPQSVSFGDGRVDFDGSRLTITTPHQGNTPRIIVYEIVR